MQIKAQGLEPEDFEIAGNRYLIEPYDVAQVGAGGIILPQDDSNTRFWNAGRVVAVGDGDNREGKEVVAMKYKVGDYLTWERLSGREYYIAGKRYHIVYAPNILAKLQHSHKWLEGK
jgi:co-chaperonin GroES (HSP10)